MNRDILLHPVTLAILVVVLSTLPFAVMASTTETPHETNTSIVVGIHGPGNDGYVIGYDSEGDEKWRVGDAGAYFDVTKLDNGNVMATYAKGHENCENRPDGCGETGIRIIDPNTESIVWEWSKNVRTIHNSEIHDAEPTDNGFVFVGMDTERVYRLNKSTKETSILWDASSTYDEPADRTKEDWLHANDIDQLEDGRLLVSVRNVNQLLILNQSGTVVETVNTKSNESVLKQQHNPQWLADGRILVADSENRRIVELQRTNGTWQPVWGINQAYSKRFQWPRDADRLPNGNTLITDSRNNRVVEIDSDGKTVNVWHTAALPYEADAVSVGEPVGGPTQNGSVAAGSGYTLPGFGFLHLILTHVFALPRWVSEWHVLLWFFAGIGISVGTGFEVKERL